ncbi:M20 aminoacylase family protein [Gluconacetobacter sacchari]|uniref:Amidohydrolase n=2 Tax=Gluconacetobacter sacchari TaxID=92759 RepID=A0A7W4ICY3_9PROT|nr:M20 aminoacylase family protein [Gluconacetobacter sacchari]MBB2160553.1 amidohydrolase [Gluconacetobacter sacchari]
MTAIGETLIADLEEWKSDFIAIRHALHQNPELGFAETETSALVARLLREWGYDVHTGLGATGVVGVLRAGDGARSIGLRADMDALPITEQTHLPYASRNPGRMHACGHDGHTTTLLAAARYLATHRRFDGTLNLIFQPAEETLRGAPAMMDAGLFERFPCDAIYALHNAPGVPVGKFIVASGSVLPSSDRVVIQVLGMGGHGAMPHRAKDPVPAAAEIVLALQGIVARNIAAGDPAVITVGVIKAGEAENVIPASAEIRLSVRALRPETRELLKVRIAQVVHGVVAAQGLTVDYDYQDGVPVLCNSEAETDFARNVIIETFGAEALFDPPRSGLIGSEDFAWMLRARPGSYVGIGNGQTGAHARMVHNPEYDFNDDVIPYGAAYWIRLVERALT